MPKHLNGINMTRVRKYNDIVGIVIWKNLRGLEELLDYLNDIMHDDVLIGVEKEGTKVIRVRSPFFITMENDLFNLSCIRDLGKHVIDFINYNQRDAIINQSKVRRNSTWVGEQPLVIGYMVTQNVLIENEHIINISVYSIYILDKYINYLKIYIFLIIMIFFVYDLIQVFQKKYFNF